MLDTPPQPTKHDAGEEFTALLAATCLTLAEKSALLAAAGRWCMATLDEAHEAMRARSLASIAEVYAKMCDRCLQVLK